MAHINYMTTPREGLRIKSDDAKGLIELPLTSFFTKLGLQLGSTCNKLYQYKKQRAKHI